MGLRAARIEWSEIERPDIDPPDLGPPDWGPLDVEPPDIEPWDVDAPNVEPPGKGDTGGVVRDVPVPGCVRQRAGAWSTSRSSCPRCWIWIEDSGWIPGWGPVIADIARQVALDEQARPAWAWSVTDESGQLLHHGYTARRAPAAERAFVKARDRTCRAPGCRRPAIRCDTDHRLDYVDGGPSHRANGCSLCRLCRRRHKRHYAAQRIMPRSVLKSLRCRASVAESAA